MTSTPSKTPVHHNGDGVIRETNPDWNDRSVQPVHIGAVDRVRAYMAEDAKIDTAIALAQLEALHLMTTSLAIIATSLSRISEVMTQPSVAAGFERQVDRILTNLERSDEEEARREVESSFDKMVFASDAELAS